MDEQPETLSAVRLRSLLVALIRVRDLRHFLAAGTPEHDAAIAIEGRLAEQIRRLEEELRNERGE
jgi:hypothetical protein